MVETGGETGARIGTRLRAAREKKGLSVLQAAERLHLDARILEWLEAENFAALGAPVYARGHLRHYAELVDESPAQLQELYVEATRATPGQPDLTKIARAEPVSDTSRLAVPAMIGLAAIAVIGTVWWFIQSSGSGHPAVAPTQAPTHPVTQSATAGESAAGTSGGAPGTPVPAPTAPGMANTKPTTPGARAAATSALAASASTPNNRAVNAPGTASVATPAATSTAGATAPPPSPRGKEGELTLKFNADSWAEVYDATGERLFYDVGAASSTHTVRGPTPLRVALGNAAGVSLVFNGRPAPVPASTQPDGSVRFVINARGRAVVASPASSGE
jgi:cytoskeleton protein RodZ